MSNYSTIEAKKKTGRIIKEEKEVIIKMRKEGKSYSEIADFLGTKKSRINNWCRKNGYGGFRGNPDMSPEEAERVLASRLDEYYKGRFTYIGGYTHSDGRVEVYCNKCENSLSVLVQSIRKKRNIICTSCNDKRKMIMAVKKKTNKLQKALDNNHKAILDKVKRQHDYIIEVCSECNNTFKGRGKGEACSVECRNKRRNRRSNRIKELRKRNMVIIDRDITLEKLIERDNNTCHICNEQCDIDDKEVTEEGHFIVGRDYPSIDHVKPVSKGGEHSWDNVKLAHHYCNTIKNDEYNAS